MTWRLGYSDFFHDFRGQECIVVFKADDDVDWWIAPLNVDGSEGEAFQDLTEESALALLIGEYIMDYDD